MKIKYNIYLIHENMENDKIVGLREGSVIFDHISKKHDKVLHDNLGSIEISGDIDFMQNFIILDEDYDERYSSIKISELSVKG